MARDDERGWLGRVGSHVWERVKAIGPEAFETLTDKVIPQGAAEISQALNSQSNAYVAYGAGQNADLSVGGPQQNYTDMIREASQRVEHGQERGPEMER